MPERLQECATVGDSLRMTTRRLEQSGALRPRRHAELLLETALGLNRVQLYLNCAQTMTPQNLNRLEVLIQRREAGEPVQYIAGWAPFYGLKLEVTAGVFIPRFETETLVARAVELANMSPAGRPVRVLDLCAGSGAVGLAIAAEVACAEATLLELEPEPIACALRNARRLGVADRVSVVAGDALDQFSRDWHGGFQLVVANPPYIAVDEMKRLPPDVRDGEPQQALTDGGDGLSFYRRWRGTVPTLLAPGGRFLTEVDEARAQAVVNILRGGFRAFTVHKDINGCDRIVEAEP